MPRAAQSGVLTEGGPCLTSTCTRNASVHMKGLLPLLGSRLSGNGSGDALRTAEIKLESRAAASGGLTDVPPVRVVARSRVRDPHDLPRVLSKLIQCVDDRSGLHRKGDRRPHRRLPLHPRPWLNHELVV